MAPSLFKCVCAAATLAAIGVNAAPMVLTNNDDGACQVTISVKTVPSGTDRGDIEAVLITGAVSTHGPSTEESCVYYNELDTSMRSPQPLYKGQDTWAHVQVSDGCAVHIDASVPSNSPLRQHGYVAVVAGPEPGTQQLHIGGLPVYQYKGDAEAVQAGGASTCLGNDPNRWTSILADGMGAWFDVGLLHGDC